VLYQAEHFLFINRYTPSLGWRTLSFIKIKTSFFSFNHLFPPFITFQKKLKNNTYQKIKSFRLNFLIKTKEAAYDKILIKIISCLVFLNNPTRNPWGFGENRNARCHRIFFSIFRDRKGWLQFLFLRFRKAVRKYPLNFSKLLLPQEEGYYQEARDIFAENKQFGFLQKW